jgi:predicted AlkP superfamily phosphohydrolase/phosphomutase
MSRRTIAIGLDGATFDVLQPLMREGYLPNLKNLMDRGAAGSLRSVFPPVTGPAWLCLGTGLMPEQTGLYDFAAVQGNAYRLSRGTHSARYRRRAIWDYLSAVGKRVFVLAYPSLYPAYPINGIMVSGAGGLWEGQSTFPKDVKAEVYSVLSSDFRPAVRYHDLKYDDVGLFLSDLNENLSQKVRVAEHFLAQEEWDFAWIVFSESDWLQHRLWHAFDETHPRHPGPGNPLTDQFKLFWADIDGAIGHLLGLVDSHTNVLVVSDHGFGPNTSVFKINAWLDQLGCLQRKTGLQNTRSNLERAARSSLRWLGHKFGVARYEILYSKGKELAVNLDRENAASRIDLERSLVFDPGHTIPAALLYVHERLDRQSNEYKALRLRLEEELDRLEATYRLSVDVASPAAGGTWTDEGILVPDYVILLDEGGCVFDKVAFEGPLLEERCYTRRHTGSHRGAGIFILTGPDVVPHWMEEVEIADVVPTLLSIFGLPLPAELSGQVIAEALTEQWLTDNPVAYGAPAASLVSSWSGLTEDEEEALKEQLRGLGYL